MKQFLAFDSWDDLIRVAKGNTPSEVRLLDGDDLEAFKELLDPKEVTHCLASEESSKLIQAARQAGFKVEVLPRPLAICWAGKGQAGFPAVVVSVALSNAYGWLVDEGGSVGRQPVEDARLSVKGLWEQEVAANPSRQRLIEAYLRKDADYQEELLSALYDALRSGEEKKLGPVRLRPPLDFTASRNRLKRFISQVDPQGRAKTLYLTDWAVAHCNIQSLLEEEFASGYEIVGAGPDGGFASAVRGLANYARSAGQPAPKKLAKLELPQKKVEFSEVAPDDNPSQSLPLKNVGTASLKVVFESDQEWLAAVPDTVISEPGQEQSITIGIDAGRLQPARSYSGKLSLRWQADGAEGQDAVQVSVRTAVGQVLCCADPQCPEHVVEGGEDVCPACRGPLKPASLERWLEKRVRPQLERGPTEFLQQMEDLLGEASRAKLDSQEARDRLDGAFRADTGAGTAAFAQWLRDHVEPIRSSPGADPGKLKLLLDRAAEAGIRPERAQPILDALLPVSQPEPPPLPETPPMPSFVKKKAPPRRPSRIWGAVLGIGLVSALIAWQFIGSSETAPPTAGSLVIRTNVPANAILDGFITPQGTQPSTVHEFPGLDARTHQVRVWRDGYQDATRKVTVAVGEDKEVTIELRKE